MAAEKTELRQLVRTELLQALDGIALSKDMERHAFVEKILEAEVKRVAHEAMVLQRVLRGNPYLLPPCAGKQDAAGQPLE